MMHETRCMNPERVVIYGIRKYDCMNNNNASIYGCYKHLNPERVHRIDAQIPESILKLL
jgi:hypothetical protein